MAGLSGRGISPSGHLGKACSMDHWLKRCSYHHDVCKMGHVHERLGGYLYTMFYFRDLMVVSSSRVCVVPILLFLVIFSWKPLFTR